MVPQGQGIEPDEAQVRQSQVQARKAGRTGAEGPNAQEIELQPPGGRRKLPTAQGYPVAGHHRLGPEQSQAPGGGVGQTLGVGSSGGADEQGPGAQVGPPEPGHELGSGAVIASGMEQTQIADI